MTNVANLVANITADTRQFDRAISKSVDRLRTLGRATSQIGRTTARFGVIGGVAAVGLGRFALSVSNAVDDMADMGDRIRLDVNNMMAFQRITKAAGSNVETFVAAIQRAQTNAVKATEGNKKLSEAFARLGINTAEFLKLDTPKQIEAISKGLSEIKDPAERTALAMTIMGKGAAGLVTTLGGGADALNKMVANANMFGKLTDEQQKQLEAFDKSWQTLSNAVDSFKTQLGAVLAGPGTKLVDWLTTSLPGAVQKSMIAVGQLADLIKNVQSGGFSTGGAVVGGLAGARLGHPVKGAIVGGLVGKEAQSSLTEALHTAPMTNLKTALPQLVQTAWSLFVEKLTAKFGSSDRLTGAANAAEIFKGAFQGITPEITTTNLIVKTGERTYSSVPGTPQIKLPKVPGAEGTAEGEAKKQTVLLQQGNKIWSETRDLLRNGVPAVAQ